MLLIYTRRFTPARADCRARFSVPCRFTSRNSASGSPAVSRMMCTRAARWTTTSTPRSASVQSVPPPIGPTIACSTLSILASSERTAVRMAYPCRNNSAQSDLPTKPLAPVIRKLCRMPKRLVRQIRCPAQQCLLPLQGARLPALAATKRIPPCRVEFSFAPCRKEVLHQTCRLEDILARLGPLAYRPLSINNQFMHSVTLRRGKVDRTGAISSQYASLRGVLQPILHELERLQRKIQIGYYHRRTWLARAAGHKIQPQFRVVRVPILRSCNAIELGDGQQSHLQRFQRTMHINLYVRRQCQRYVFPGMRKINIQCSFTAQPAHAKQVTQRLKRMRANQQGADAKKSIFGQAPDDAKVLR